MNNECGTTPLRRSRAYQWLADSFEDRTVAEMSICLCITATALFMVALPLALAIAGPGDADSPPRDERIVAGMLTALGLWLALAGWMGVSFVRIARGWGPQRLGTRIFKLLQRGWLVATALTMLAHGLFFTQLNIFLLMLLAFDVAILEMVVVFFLLAWLARCQVPRRTYWDIAVIVLVFALQVMLFR